MRLIFNKATTLLELVIAIGLLGILVLGISSIDTFSRHQLRMSDRRARMQNEMAFLLEHMAKNINNAIGFSDDTVTRTEPGGSNVLLEVWVDNLTEGNPYKGYRDGTDYKISYLFDRSAHKVTYSSPSGDDELVSTNIYDFIASYNESNNYVQVDALSCWNTSRLDCGVDINNPAVNMSSRIEMPSVSTN